MDTRGDDMTIEVATIYNDLNRFFEAKQYHKVPTDVASVQMYAVMQKSSLYLFNIIPINEEFVFDEVLYEKYRQTTMKQFEKVPTDNVILVNLLIVKDQAKLYDHANKTPNLTERFIDVHWLIDATTRKLVIPKQQLKSVLGIEKELRGLVEEGHKEVFSFEPLSKHVFVTYTIMLINVLIWFFMELEGSSYDSRLLLAYGALNATYVFELGQYWRMFTAMFLHVGLAHLVFNGVSLYIFGSRLEKYIAWWQFIAIYLLSGFIGSAFSLGASQVLGLDRISVGASGAIYGLMGSFLICTKAAHRPLENLNSYIIWLFFIIGIVYSVVDTNVDAAAHLGGFLGGLILTIPVVWYQKKKQHTA